MLNDLLHLTDEEIRRTKIRCCTEYNRYNPAEEFKKDPDMFNTEWILSRKKNKDGRGVVPERLRTLDHGRPWSDDQFASTRLSSNRDMSR